MTKKYINRSPDYRDISLDFFKDRTTGDVAMLEGHEAIKRAIRNLILSNYYERPFRSYLASNVRGVLFNNFSSFAGDDLKDAIIAVIKNFEPRVKLLDVQITQDTDRNGFNCQLYYMILNREQPVVTSIFLEKIR